MGRFVICAFRPKPGKDQALRDVLKDHMPTLRGQDLITNRPAYLMRAADGTILEIFEWKSAAAVDAAHDNPAVRELWGRFDEVCESIALRDVPGTDGTFPNFDAIDLK